MPEEENLSANSNQLPPPPKGLRDVFKAQGMNMKMDEFVHNVNGSNGILMADGDDDKAEDDADDNDDDNDETDETA